jgi:hypothetical protein
VHHILKATAALASPPMELGLTGRHQMTPEANEMPMRIAARPMFDAPPHSWSMQHLKQFEYAARQFSRAGMSVRVEIGLSDEGDPWSVFYCPKSGVVLAHFARIDGIYIVDWHQLSRPTRSNELPEVLARFLRHSLGNNGLSETMPRHPLPELRCTPHDVRIECDICPTVWMAHTALQRTAK